MKMGKKRDVDDEKAVEEVLCEAMDLLILEQVAEINNLPSHLQTPPPSFPTQFTFNTSPVRVGAKNREHQTKKKLQRYEKWVSQPPSNSSSSASFGRFSRGGIWCWKRESKEERERNLRKMVEKAKKEEKKIRDEAEKLIKWVNYASAQI